MAKIDDLIKEIETLTVLEVSDLVKALEEKFGVSAAAPVAVAAVASNAQATSQEEEKSAYTVVIASAGDQKINLIKVIREIKPDLGLKEAKDMTEAVPATLAENVKTEEANEMKKKLEAVGAKVELK